MSLIWVLGLVNLVGFLIWGKFGLDGFWRECFVFEFILFVLDCLIGLKGELVFRVIIIEMNFYKVIER